MLPCRLPLPDAEGARNDDRSIDRPAWVVVRRSPWLGSIRKQGSPPWDLNRSSPNSISSPPFHPPLASQATSSSSSSNNMAAQSKAAAGRKKGALTAKQKAFIQKMKDAVEYVEGQTRGLLLRTHWRFIVSIIDEMLEAKKTHGMTFKQLAELLGKNRKTILLWRKIHDSGVLQVRWSERATDARVFESVVVDCNSISLTRFQTRTPSPALPHPTEAG